MALNQTNRLIRMTKGPLGPDEVVVTSLTGREEISRPFSLHIEFISTRLDLKPADIIGSAVSIEIDRRDRTAGPLAPRHFHGYVSRFAAGTVELKDPGDHRFRQYRAEIVPWLWFLTQTARCYLFFPEKEDKSIFEVIEAVINRAGSDLHVDAVADLKGIGDLASRKVKHCVQYRETDFNFLSRTLEQYGAFYYFKFEEGKHTLVVDLKKNYPVCEEAEVTYPRQIGPQPPSDHVTSWQHDYEFVPGKWSHTDYNYETPSTPLITSAPRLPSVDVPTADKYEVYDYPGGYAVKPNGETDARVRQEERELPHNSVEGTSTCRTFTPGYKFTLVAHPDDEVVSEQGVSYLLTAVQHSASQPSDDTSEGDHASYSNRFTCIHDSVQFRPPRRTPRPVISGVQTAVVVGPPGNELYTDPQGRVKVQFHWDRVGKKDQNTSCWIRVAQMWAGKGWGSVSTPRIGHEVIVEFLEGDPDQPIITGSVHNADNKPPHTGVVSGIKSTTHKGKGYNQMTMDDTAGKEKITIHGQYDMGTTVQHDQTDTINNNRTTKVAVDDQESIGANQKIDIGSDRTLDIGSNDKISIGSAQDVKVGANQKIGVGANRTISITANEEVSAGANMKHSAAANLDLSAGVDLTAVGGVNVKISGGATVDVAAGATIKLSAAGSSIEIGPAGIKITSGALVTVMGSTIKLN